MGTNVRQNIVTNGLVMYLDAGNRMSYTSGSTTWRDLSGNGSNGTLTVSGSGAVSASFDSTSQGNIVFSGTGSYVDCGSSTSLNFGSGNYTIGVWFKASTTSVRRTILSRFDYDGTGTIERGYTIDVLSTGKIRAVFETNGSNYRITDSLTTVTTNQYFYATVTRTNATTINCYINGVFETSNTLTAGTPSSIDVVTAPFTIGRRFDYLTSTVSNFFSGSVAQSQIYNRALSNQEIAQNYNATKTRFGLT